MAVERQQAEWNYNSLFNRIKQNPISQRFLGAGVRIALAAAILTPAVIADNISTFVKPASAAESTTTASIPTWINRCGPNTHLPFSTQSTYDGRVITKFLTFPETQQYLPTVQQWYAGNTYPDIIADLNSFWNKKMGILVSKNESSPIVANLTQSLETYKKDINRFFNDIDAIPSSVQSTENFFIIEIAFYVTDPSITSITAFYPYPGSWGGARGRNGTIIMPANSLNPNLPTYDKKLVRKTMKHEYGHNVTRDTSDPSGQGHNSNPKDIMYFGPDPDLSDDETLVAKVEVDPACPSGDPDPDISNLKTKLYLPYTTRS